MNSKIKWTAYAPLAVLLLLGFFLARGLSLDPKKLPSTLIDEPVPTFQLPTIVSEGHFSPADLKGQVSLVSVWATWCPSCLAEHQVMMQISEHFKVPIYGIDYKDDRTQARKWLKTYGNPYRKVGDDANGLVAIDWGVYGTPETFVVDKRGVIRYKHIGVIGRQDWDHIMMPLIEQLREEAA